MDVDVFIPPGLTAAETIELGTLAEDVGIRAIWTYNYIADPDPFVNLSWLARETKTIRMGPVAVSPFQLHPLMMANSLLTLNELAEGRADIIVGGGGAVLAAIGGKAHRKVRAVHECVPDRHRHPRVHSEDPQRQSQGFRAHDSAREHHGRYVCPCLSDRSAV